MLVDVLGHFLRLYYLSLGSDEVCSQALVDDNLRRVSTFSLTSARFNVSFVSISLSSYPSGVL
jgi:hypothetical protein